jgi:hypothetical protein
LRPAFDVHPPFSSDEQGLEKEESAAGQGNGPSLESEVNEEGMTEGATSEGSEERQDSAASSERREATHAKELRRSGIPAFGPEFDE